MSEPILVVTTPTVEGCVPKAVLGYVSANSVWESIHLAERRFKEEYSNGRYGIYEAIMERLEKDVLRDIKAKARALGANAIVGLTIRYGNGPILKGAQGAFMGCEGDRWFAHAEGTALLLDLPSPPQP